MSQNTDQYVYGGQDPEILAQQQMYNWQTAAGQQTAVNNVLRDLGYNPYAANPFVQQMKGLGQGYSQHWLAQHAMNPQLTAASLPASFASYRDMLQNSFRNGSMIADISRTGGGMRDLVGSMRNYSSQLASGIPADQLNPYMAYLQPQMATGQGTADFLSNLYAPLMGRGMQQAYGAGLGALADTAGRNIAQAHDVTGDIWKYFFGF